MTRTAVPEPFELVALPWEAQPGRWSMTLCLRASFSLVHAGPCEPLEPVSTTHTVDGSWDEANEKILHLSDLVPFKPRADVLVLGHAFAPWGTPVRALVARLRVGELTKAVRVVGDRTWRWVGGRWIASEPRPFTSKALRWEGAMKSPLVPAGLDPSANPVEGCPAGPTFEGHGGALPGLGPIPPGWPQRYGLVDEAALEWALGFAGGGPVAGGQPTGFPFAFFNVAPPDQQLDLVKPGAPLILEHLSPDRPLLATHVPTVRPRVSRRGPGGRRADVALRCDTLWIDTDRGACTMLWRGIVDVEGPLAVPELTITVDGLPRSATSASKARAPAPPRLEQTQDVPLETVDRALAALPFGGTGDSRPPERTPHDESTSALGDEGSTTHSGDAEVPARVAPPPRVGSIPDIAPPPRVGSIPDIAPPPRVGSIPDVAPPLRLGSIPDVAPPLRLGSIPDVAPPPRLGSIPDVAPPPRLGSIPDVEATIPSEAPAAASEAVDPDAVDLPGCAAIAAELARPGADRAAVLAAKGIDEPTWSRIDRRWKQAIDADARKGSTALLETYDDAFLAAMAVGGRPIGVLEYARISVGKTRGDLAEILEALQFPRVELLRLTRVWTRRTKGDPQLAKELESAVAAEGKR